MRWKILYSYYEYSKKTNVNHLIFTIKSAANGNIRIAIIIFLFYFLKLEKLLLISHEIRTTKGPKITHKKTTSRLLKIMCGRRVNINLKTPWFLKGICYLLYVSFLTSFPNLFIILLFIIVTGWCISLNSKLNVKFNFSHRRV